MSDSKSFIDIEWPLNEDGSLRPNELGISQNVFKRYGIYPSLRELQWEIKKARAVLKTVACMAYINSKDPSSKVGAMIVRPNFSYVSSGYNGFPMGMHDDPEIWNDRARKYDYVQHAERNALAFSHSVDVHGCYLVVNLYPCHDCAGLIIQHGIKKIFYSASKREDHKCKIADEIFNNAGVTRIRIPGIVNLTNEPIFTGARWDETKTAETTTETCQEGSSTSSSKEDSEGCTDGNCRCKV